MKGSKLFMEQNIIQKVLDIKGMTCPGCETRIENKLKGISGIISVNAVFDKAKVYITYDSNKVSLSKITGKLEELDYKASNSRTAGSSKSAHSNNFDYKSFVKQLAGFAVILFALYIIIMKIQDVYTIPQLNKNMGYGVLFIVGLLSSLHCIAMCGGINFSQCISYGSQNNKTGSFDKLKPSFMYNSGRVISYTIIGGVLGAIGGTVTFSGKIEGTVTILSGIFMIIIGLNMAGVFLSLGKISPKLPKVFSSRIFSSSKKNGPFIVGLLNGLMPCGPLQAIQLYALGTGSFTAGALSMFMFSLGTIPLMFTFGAFSSFLGKGFTKKMMKVSAALVIVLGFFMLIRGFGLSGLDMSTDISGASDYASRVIGNEQIITTRMSAGKYPSVSVQKGIPVKWNMKVEEGDLSSCNRILTIPKYNIRKTLQPGDNVIAFTPENTGNITYRCSMGMIRSNIKVVDDMGGGE